MINLNKILFDEMSLMVIYVSYKDVGKGRIGYNYIFFNSINVFDWFWGVLKLVNNLIFLNCFQVKMTGILSFYVGNLLLSLKEKKR